MRNAIVLLVLFCCIQNKGNLMAKENEFVDDPIQREITRNAVFELNQNSYLGYDFLVPLDEGTKEKIQLECNGNWITNYMSHDYYGDNITWIFSGYPHDECSSFLTEVRFCSDNHNVFGIKPGDDISIAEDKLLSLGFEHNNGYSRRRYYSYNKGDLFIAFDNFVNRGNGEHSKIETITVQVRTFYLGNRIY